MHHFAEFKQSVRDLDLWLSALVTHGFEDCNGLISIFRASLCSFVQYCVLTSVDFFNLPIFTSHYVKPSVTNLSQGDFFKELLVGNFMSHICYVADTQLIHRKN